MKYDFGSRIGKIGLLALAGAVASVASSCQTNLAGNSEAPVYLVWQCIAPPDYVVNAFEVGAVYLSDVIIESKEKCVGSESECPGPDKYGDVLLEQLRIKYRRTDGGTDVPGDTVFNISGKVPANGDLHVAHWLVLLTEDQKLTPPISDLNTYGVELATGLTHIQLDAELYLHGRTIAGDDLVARATVPIRVCSSVFDTHCLAEERTEGTCQN
ncbi:MAG: hypothetical protein HYV63_05950 [Candidatus Schekmanbacteria bacterium]|nr:hypothetical protein [Candidatus Schekmanbacteria bacterium]